MQFWQFWIIVIVNVYKNKMDLSKAQDIAGKAAVENISFKNCIKVP